MITEDKYVRSAAEDKFEEYDSNQAMVIWLDVLGVRNLPHKELVNRLDTLLNIAGRASSLGPKTQNDTIIGTPQWLFQYCVVGDALVMAEKYSADLADAPNAPKLALIKGALFVSQELFLNNIPHRGVATIGKVKCKIDNRAAIVTGEAVLKAYCLESTTNALGLFLSNECTSFVKWYDQYQKINANKALPVRLDSLGIRKHVVQKLFSYSPSLHLSHSVLGNSGQRDALVNYTKRFSCAKKVLQTKLALKL